MGISFDTFINIASLLLGGGGGAFFVWRWQRKKAKAEAQEAEASAAKELQDMYQQMVADAKEDREDRKRQNEELRAERDHYKQERNELREEVSQLRQEMQEWKQKAEDERISMKRDIARLGRQMECLRPFLCGREGCQIRVPVTISATGEVETTSPNVKKDIEPIGMKDL